MSQWKKKILNRKNGKGTVTNAKDDDEVKVTKVLEFIPATSQKDAKEGKTIRFMHNTGDWNDILAPRNTREKIDKI